MRRAMEHSGINYVEVADEAAFYGPKIDVQIWSAIGKEFTLATNQVDFAEPARFDLTFTAAMGPTRRRCASTARREHPPALLRLSDRALRGAISRSGWRPSRCG